MPILKREPDITPGLFELDPAAHPWRVAHVRSRQEKLLARHCVERGIPFYLPLTASAPGPRRTADGGRRTVPGRDDLESHPAPRAPHSGARVRVSHAPLFPGYVFLRAASAQRVDALRSNVIVSLLEVTDQDSLAGELGQIHALQQAGAVLVPFPWLAVGDAVRIRDGAFRGWRGVVVKEKGAERLVVSVSMIMRSVLVELGRENVVPGAA